MASSSSPSSSSISRRSTTAKEEEVAGDDTDLSKLVLREIGFVKESFEAVKIKASQKIDEANEAEEQFEELMSLPAGRGEEREYKLRQLKMKVSKLRMEIPFKLIAPSSEQPNHPNIIRWRRLDSNLYGGDKEEIISHNNSFQPDIIDDHELDSIFQEIGNWVREYVACFVFFPKNAVIKRRVLFCLRASFIEDYSQDELGCLVAKGLVQEVYNKSNLTVDGYRMHPSAHSYFKSLASRGFFNGEWENMYVGPCHDVEEKFIYHTALEFQQHFNNNSHHTGGCQRIFLHLGKWNNSTKQHIEIVDPEQFLKDMSKHIHLTYVNLSGISMIEELPEFITKLKYLRNLDLRACHNLEVIPPSIANLRRSLRYLDISECYFLDHMPKALASLDRLQILKGFVVGENTDNKSSCTLEDLASIRPPLEKLNIYTSIKRFPTKSQLANLHGFLLLRSLTISWGGCSAPNGLGKLSQEHEYGKSKELMARDYDFDNLEKLDLQCVPETVTRSWLKPTNFRNLKKLYIRGGKFFDLDQSLEASQWNVETLRLKHLCNLNMYWDELQRLFPKLICLEKVNCPNLHQFPCNDSGIWMKNQQA